MDKVLARFGQPWTTYFFIMAEYLNKGYAQQAIREAEKIYGSDHWCLDTILQEKGNLHLYEKIGYHRTGKIDKINDGMDIVYYEKTDREH